MRLAITVNAHAIVDQERQDAAQVQTQYSQLSQSLLQTLTSIEKAEAAGQADSSEQMMHLRLTERDMRALGAELLNRYNRMLAGLINAVSDLAEFDADLLRRGRECLERTGLLHQHVDLGDLKTKLFTVEGDDSKESAAPKAPQAQDAGSQVDPARSMVEDERREALRHFVEAEQRLEDHREG